MSVMSRNCRGRVQRLRGGGDDTPLPLGSWGFAPGALRHLLPPCCSNPRRDWLCQTVRLCECAPWVISAVKSSGALNHTEIPAKIVAFRKVIAHPVRHSGASRNLPLSCGKTPAFAGVTAQEGRYTCSQASGHRANTQYQYHRSNGLEAKAGTHPPLPLEAPGGAPLWGEAGPIQLAMPP